MKYDHNEFKRLVLPGARAAVKAHWERASTSLAEDLAMMAAVGPGFMMGADEAAENVRKSAIENAAPVFAPRDKDEPEVEYDPYDPKNWGV